MSPINLIYYAHILSRPRAPAPSPPLQPKNTIPHKQIQYPQQPNQSGQPQNHCAYFSKRLFNNSRCENLVPLVDCASITVKKSLKINIIFPFCFAFLITTFISSCKIILLDLIPHHSPTSCVGSLGNYFLSWGKEGLSLLVFLSLFLLLVYFSIFKFSAKTWTYITLIKKRGV